MSGRGLTLAVPLLLTAILALAAGCGDGAGGKATPGATATGEEARTPSAVTMTPAPDIRQQDLADQPGLRDFLGAAGGEVDERRITYVDLTEDGVEEAVVPVSSGGEGGDIAVFVFGYGAGGLQELLRRLPEGGPLSVNIVAGALTIIEPVFAPGDPLCCPSQLRTTTYRWDGNDLVVAEEKTAPTAGN